MCRWRSGLCSGSGGLVVDGSVQGHLNALAKSKEVCLGCEPGKARKVGREEPVFLTDGWVSIPSPGAEVGKRGTMNQKV